MILHIKFLILKISLSSYLHFLLTRVIFRFHRARNHQEGGDSVPAGSQVQGNGPSSTGPGPYRSQNVEGPHSSLIVYCPVRSHGDFQVHEAQSCEL